MKNFVTWAMRILLRMDDLLTNCINRTALLYDDGVHVKHRLTRYHDFFVERIRSGEYALDIGCGIGAVAYSIASRSGAKVLGIDLNAENIQKAQTLYQHANLSFANGDALGDLPGHEFDVVVLSNILEHIEKRVEFLTSVQRKFQPKRWLIRVPMINRDWRVPMRKELGLFYFSDRTHFVEYTQDSFKEELRAAGLLITFAQCNWGEIWAEATFRG